MPDVEVVHVAIVRDGEPLAIMQVVAADGRSIDREVTDAVIEDEIEKSELAGVVRWVRVAASEIPKDRSQRSSWRLEGNRVVAP